MSQKFEYYTAGDDGNYEIHGNNWYAQTFTPLVGHQITSAKLLIYKVGSPGDLLVGIKATDGSGHPTGDDLCNGTIAEGDIGTSKALIEVSFGDGALLTTDKYAIVAHLAAGDASNKVRWRRDASSSTYPRGNAEYGYPWGAWTGYANVDCLFEEWGELLPPAAGGGSMAAKLIGGKLL